MFVIGLFRDWHLSVDFEELAYGVVVISDFRTDHIGISVDDAQLLLIELFVPEMEWLWMKNDSK